MELVWVVFAKKEKDSPTSNKKRRCLSGSCERPDRCQRSPLSVSKKSKSIVYWHEYLVRVTAFAAYSST